MFELVVLRIVFEQLQTDIVVLIIMRCVIDVDENDEQHHIHIILNLTDRIDEIDETQMFHDEHENDDVHDWHQIIVLAWIDVIDVIDEMQLDEVDDEQVEPAICVFNGIQNTDLDQTTVDIIDEVDEMLVIFKIPFQVAVAVVVCGHEQVDDEVDDDIWHEIDEIDEIDVPWHLVQDHDEWNDEIDEMLEYFELDEMVENDEKCTVLMDQAQIQNVVYELVEKVETDIVDEMVEIQN